MKQTIGILILFSWLFPFLVYGQTTEFNTSLNYSVVGIEDVFTVTYSANKEGEFVAPTFKDFEVVGGPSRSNSSSITIINGQVNQKVTISYSYYLKPKKLGEFKIPGASIKVNNAVFESQTVTVKVVKDSQVKQQPQRRSIFDDFFGPPTPQRQPQIPEDALLAKMEISKGKVYQGEHLIVTYKVLARGVSFNMEDFNFPTHEGFWIENIDLPNQMQPTIEVVDGKQYQAYVVKKEVLFPQEIGKITLKPFDITGRINASVFSAGVEKKLQSNSVTVQVMALPPNPPASFNNQVGNYTFEATLKNATVKVDEAIDLKVVVAGTGNLKQLNGLDFAFPEDFETFDPQIKESIAISEGGLSGSKTMNYLSIPRHSGKYEIGPLEFSYFDLKSKSYKTLKSPVFTITVLKQDGSVDNTNRNGSDFNASNKAKKEGEVSDILRSSARLQNKSPFFLSTNYFVLLVSIVLLFFVYKYVNHKVALSKLDTRENKIKRASKEVIKRLALAKSHLDANRTSFFYKETLASLYKYIEDKLGIEVASMSKQTIKERLTAYAVNKETIEELIQLLETCEMAQFGSFSSQANEKTIYTKSILTIEQIENEFKA